MASPPPFPMPPSPEQRPDEKKPSVLWEDIVVVLAIPVLWLFVLRLHGVVYHVIGYVTLAALAYILWRRIKRINEAAQRRRPNDREPRPGP